jgi:hypothetical protein
MIDKALLFHDGSIPHVSVHIQQNGLGTSLEALLGVPMAF